MALQETITSEGGAQWLDTRPDSEGGLQLGSVAGKFSVLGAAAHAQHAATGSTAGFVAGGGTTVTSTSTFSGTGTGTSYTVGDAIAALKEFGFLKA